MKTEQPYELKILEDLLRGKKMTAQSIREQFKTLYGTTFISRLRGKGFPIMERTVKSKDGKWYNVYSL